ncbi:uncharacterized protein LOC135097699 isoform X2 [Scylla paramamosain]|uniref:uncharacterized protein LOC135097699 isoform X2 n=1 Tax=Scylla paramamosain TaxID=85552 RepID=UPI003082E588
MRGRPKSDTTIDEKPEDNLWLQLGFTVDSETGRRPTIAEPAHQDSRLPPPTGRPVGGGSLGQHHLGCSVPGPVERRGVSHQPVQCCLQTNQCCYLDCGIQEGGGGPASVIGGLTPSTHYLVQVTAYSYNSARSYSRATPPPCPFLEAPPPLG